MCIRVTFSDAELGEVCFDFCEDKYIKCLSDCTISYCELECAPVLTGKNVDKNVENSLTTVKIVTLHVLAFVIVLRAVKTVRIAFASALTPKTIRTPSNVQKPLSRASIYVSKAASSTKAAWTTASTTTKRN